MIPAASVTGYAVKTAQPATLTSAARVAQMFAPEAARASAGETSAAQITMMTARAVTAPDQAAVAPRLRDQETAERTERAPQAKDAPTGPPPAFKESPLERQARIAFDPPEVPTLPEPVARDVPNAVAAPSETDLGQSRLEAAPPADPPPTPTERAEASFAETRTISTPKEPATIDMSR